MFFVVWILCNCYILYSIIQILNYTFIFHFVLPLFVLYLFPSLGKKKFFFLIRRKEEIHTDLPLRYINVGKVNKDSFRALKQTDFFFKTEV